MTSARVVSEDPALAESGLRRGRLSARDVLQVGSLGLRTLKLRAALSGLGVAIGIASVVAVLGISQSSQANLLAQLDQLGTNLLNVTPGQSFTSTNPVLPTFATSKIAALRDVNAASAVYTVPNASIRRSAYVDPQATGGIAVNASDITLPRTLGGQMASGRFLDRATARYPTVVLGAVAAQRLGIDTVAGHPQVYIYGRWFSVLGILRPLALAPEIDRAALIGLPVASSLYGTTANPTAIYLRAATNQVNYVHDTIASVADPEHPEEVAVSRPSDALAARAAAKSAFTGLLVGLGAVALFVGAVGIANVMVISVLERRSEIGLRRAIGATKTHISLQFLTESLLLAIIGGVAGVVIGIAVTVGYAAVSNLPATIPATAIVGGLAAAVMTGGIAGIYPAIRAARLAPSEALRTV